MLPAVPLKVVKGMRSRVDVPHQGAHHNRTRAAAPQWVM